MEWSRGAPRQQNDHFWTSRNWSWGGPLDVGCSSFWRPEDVYWSQVSERFNPLLCHDLGILWYWKRHWEVWRGIYGWNIWTALKTQISSESWWLHYWYDEEKYHIFSIFGSHDLGQMTPYLAQSSVKLRQFSRNPGIKGSNIGLREKLITDEMLPMKFTIKGCINCMMVYVKGFC